MKRISIQAISLLFATTACDVEDTDAAFRADEFVAAESGVEHAEGQPTQAAQAEVVAAGETGVHLEDDEFPSTEDPSIIDSDAAGGCTSVCSALSGFGPTVCAWERVSTTTADEVNVQCDSNTFAISGGCYTNDAAAHLQVSHPNEGTLSNLPEDGDEFYDADGWSCDWSKTPDAGESHIGLALCCQANRITSCSC